MKNVLLLGRLATNVPNLQTGITNKNINLFSGTNLAEVKAVFSQNNNQIDSVIMGAGIDIEVRLEVVNYIFEISKGTTVHMKDWNSGPTGMLPFVNGILNNFID